MDLPNPLFMRFQSSFIDKKLRELEENLVYSYMTNSEFLH